MSLKNNSISRKLVGSKRMNEPRLIKDVILRLLKNSNDQFFCGIRQQLASGCLPNLAQHLGAMAANTGKEVAV